MSDYHFISYSRIEAEQFAIQLCDKLTAGPPKISVWLDKREIKPADDWDEQIADAISACKSLLFVMTKDSVKKKSICKREWIRAIKCKKPIVPLLLDSDAEMPFRLEGRQYINFVADYQTALAKLRNYLNWLDSPEGILQGLKDPLEDADRELARADDEMQKDRIKDDIASLDLQIAELQ